MTASDLATQLSGFGAFRAPEAGADQPTERLVDGDRARALIKKAFDDSKSRLDQYRAIQDAYDRMPPDTDAELSADGFDGLANVNWGGMMSGVDDAAEVYINLTLEPDPLMQFSSQVNAPGAGEGLLRLGRNVTGMLRDWEELEDVVTLMIHHMVSFGLGIFHWPMPHSWHFRALHPGNLVFPKRAQLNPATWPWCAIITEFSLPDLLEKLTADNREAAKSQGWDLEAVKRAIEKFNAGDGAKRPQNMDVEELVNAFTRESCSFDDASAIKGYIFYVREFNGSITEYWLTDQEAVKPLYKRNGRYRDMGSVISLFPLGLGDGFLGRVRGYGINSLAFHDLEDRHNNRLIDTAWLASSIGLKGDQETLNRFSELVLGPIFTVPDGFDATQISFQNQTAPLVDIAHLFEQKKAGRNRAMGGQIDVSPGSDATATGARLRYQEQSGARSGAIGRYYRRLSMFYWALWQRIADPDVTETDRGAAEALAMLLETIRGGLPVPVLSGIKRVVAKRIFGDGDANNLFLALADLAPFIGRLPAGGQQFFIRHLFTSRLRNAPEVEAMLPENDLDDTETRQKRLAQIENASFQSSDVAITIAGDDIHPIHVGEHTIFAEDTVTQYENQRISLEQAFQTLTRVREHNLGHLQALQSDELSEPIFRDANNRWAAIDNTIRRLQQQLTDKRQAEQEAQLEEIKNPRPSVKDAETAQTETLKRRLAVEESKLRREQMKTEHETKMSQMELETARNNGRIHSLKEIPTDRE